MPRAGITISVLPNIPQERPHTSCQHQKQRCGKHLVPRIVVAIPGFEPRLTEPESAVLPLHHMAIIIMNFLKSGAKIAYFYKSSKRFFKKSASTISLPVKMKPKNYSLPKTVAKIASVAPAFSLTYAPAFPPAHCKKAESFIIRSIIFS